MAVEWWRKRGGILGEGGGVVEEWQTISELAESLGIPETTARRYAKTFAGYLTSRKFGRITKYDAREALEILERVSRLYGSGATMEEIAEQLGEDYTQTVEMESAPPARVNMLVPMLIAQQRGNREMQETLEKLTDTLSKLEERLAAMDAEKQHRPWWKFWG